MTEPVAGTEFSAGGVVADSRYYAGAVEALRSSCAHIGEAADAAQRARFFSDITGWNDEAAASAHDADKAAVMAMAEALRAKGAVAAYADAARSTLAEVTAAFAAPDTPSSAIVGAGATEADDVDESENEDTAFSGHLARALVALVEEREREVDSDSDEAGYGKMANTLSVLAGARSAYRAVDEALILLANARIAYLKDSLAAAQTALAADLKAAVADDIRATSIGEFRSALTTLAVTRTAYNAEIADELWGALAEARTNLAAATATVFEIQAAAGERGGADDVHSASALAYSFSDSETPADVYDAARDVVIEAKEFRRRAQAACDAVDALLVENRAVAADALIEARAVVGSTALVEIRAAYEMASAAMDSLFGARAAFEVGFDLTLPEIFGDFEF
ncbi:hypothetical protein [Candidatus Poriferisocius sp.]|uniref:hypothetical protein n=1 Tax=Candidatus Poriferisocius sp. TaxID=3101276 RepID=UPI003B016035